MTFHEYPLPFDSMMMVKSHVMLEKNFAICTDIIILTPNDGCGKIIPYFLGVHLSIDKVVSSNFPAKSEGSERAGPPLDD